eukprot:8471997-Karenia_brevis.AAC.1
MWQAAGKWVCPHGMFYRHRADNGCSCMSNDWGDAEWMPAISIELKALVVMRFDPTKARRLGQLRADIARAG